MVENARGQVKQSVPCEIQGVEVRNTSEEMGGEAVQVVGVQVELLQQGRGVQLLLGDGGDVRGLDGQHGGGL